MTLVARLLDGSEVTLDPDDPVFYLREANPDRQRRWLSFVAERSEHLAIQTVDGGVVPPRTIVHLRETPPPKAPPLKYEQTRLLRVVQAGGRHVVAVDDDIIPVKMSVQIEYGTADSEDRVGDQWLVTITPAGGSLARSLQREARRR